MPLFCFEYFIGYDIYLKDLKPVDWNYYISPVMVKSKRKRLLCEIKVSRKYNDLKFFMEKRDEILDCLLEKKAFVYSFNKKENDFLENIEVLKLPFIKIDLSFDKNRAFIWLVK